MRRARGLRTGFVLDVVLLRIFLLGAAAAAIRCGKKGDPLPPLSTRPARTTDLAVSQTGRSAEVSFSFPALRADGAALRDIDRIEIYRLENASPSLTAPPKAAAATGGAAAGASDHAPDSGVRRRAEAARRREKEILGAAHRVATIGADLLSSATRGGKVVYRDPLDAVLATAPPPTLAYAVVTVRKNGERSEISNLPTLTPAVPPEAPTDLLALGEEGRVCLEWTPPEKTLAGTPADVAGYFVYRRPLAEEDYGPPLNADPDAAPEYSDTTAAYDATWVYTVTAVPKDHPKVEGPPAIQFGLDYRDVFPPPVPERLDALAEQSVVRLTWTPVAASDLARYVLMRSVDDGALARLAEVAPTETSFEDRSIQPGHVYRYVVEAVDRSGNTSAPSPPATARPFREE